MLRSYVVVALLTTSAFATPPEPIDPVLADRIVQAIYVAEGGPKARVPFGILSVPVKDFADAKRICKNTVANNYRRWQTAGRPGAFLDFLADRYCPPKADPVGNTRWKRNVRAGLK